MLPLQQAQSFILSAVIKAKASAEIFSIKTKWRGQERRPETWHHPSGSFSR
jgi:hypothetical protein